MSVQVFMSGWTCSRRKLQLNYLTYLKICNGIGANEDCSHVTVALLLQIKLQPYMVRVVTCDFHISLQLVRLRSTIFLANADQKCHGCEYFSQTPYFCLPNVSQTYVRTIMRSIPNIPNYVYYCFPSCY